MNWYDMMCHIICMYILLQYCQFANQHNGQCSLLCFADAVHDIRQHSRFSVYAHMLTGGNNYTVISSLTKVL